MSQPQLFTIVPEVLPSVMRSEFSEKLVHADNLASVSESQWGLKKT